MPSPTQKIGVLDGQAWSLPCGGDFHCLSGVSRLFHPDRAISLPFSNSADF